MWHSFELHLNTTADGAPIMQCVCVSVTGFVVKCPILRTAQKWVEVIGYIKFLSSEAKGKESLMRTVDCAAPRWVLHLVPGCVPQLEGEPGGGARVPETMRGRWGGRGGARERRRGGRWRGGIVCDARAHWGNVVDSFFPVFEAPSLYVAGCGCVYLSAFCCCCFDVFFFVCVFCWLWVILNRVLCVRLFVRWMWVYVFYYLCAIDVYIRR